MDDTKERYELVEKASFEIIYEQISLLEKKSKDASLSIEESINIARAIGYLVSLTF